MITEELLGAYLEGNLSAEEAKYVEAELASDPDLQEVADDVYAYVDEPAPYEPDLDDIDLPIVDAEPAEIICVEVDDEACEWDAADDEISIDPVDDIDDGFEFIDDPCSDL